MPTPTPSAHPWISDADGLSASSGETAVIWLASPTAKGYFNPTRLTSEDAQRREVLRSAERTEEFVVSRSLQQYLAASDTTTSQSLSHSGKHAAMALAPQRLAVGIDLEQHRSRDLRAIARFAFSAEESAALDAIDDTKLACAFYTRWVMKEALAKALQLPLLEAARECSFVAQPEGWTGRVPDDRPWRVTAYRPLPGMSLAIAVVGDGVDHLPVRCYEWPPPRRADWPIVANVASTVYPSPKIPLFEESSTCRTMLPTS